MLTRYIQACYENLGLKYSHSLAILPKWKEQIKPVPGLTKKKALRSHALPYSFLGKVLSHYIIFFLCYPMELPLLECSGLGIMCPSWDSLLMGSNFAKVNGFFHDIKVPSKLLWKRLQSVDHESCIFRLVKKPWTWKNKISTKFPHLNEWLRIFTDDL